ncbi:hypothetical protein [Legionella spiritensis]|uniref:Uncharacterized protein n=1 Tax=Legionella spiritensis TaxID=452 RepID=A0A0W0YYC2_LEGSP|nr:hypothetical protein [Legionella spiritensis]KTD61876.1 hypothetical protein Lspi_2506 [Legionella spiritensis]SNV45484.1 Uncharacterised protein [Legionella spiritensis]
MKWLLAILLSLYVMTAVAQECSTKKQKKFITNTWLTCKASCYRYQDNMPRLNDCLDHCMNGITELKKAVCTK